MAKYVPRPFTGYLNFSPDIVSSDYAEPRAQNLNEQEARRIRASKIGAQNTKILRAASKPAGGFKRFAGAKTEARIAEDKINARVKAERIRESFKNKVEAYNAKHGTNISTKYSDKKKTK